MTNRIKRLSLESWMKFDGRFFTPEKAYVNECQNEQMKIGCDGWYYDRIDKFSWFETNGKAYTKDHLVDSFLYGMTLHEAQLLTEDQVHNIQQIISTLPKKNSEMLENLRYILRKDREVKSIRATGRGIKKMLMKHRKKNPIPTFDK